MKSSIEAIVTNRIYVGDKLMKRRFAWVTFSEAMLTFKQDIVFIKVCNNLFIKYLLEYFGQWR